MRFFASSASVSMGGFESASYVAPSRRARSSLFVEDIVFRKSLAGHNELEHRHLMLRPELRRLLILIDGHSSVEDFAPLFRVGELPKFLDELLALGLVESTSATPMFAYASLADVFGKTNALTRAQFESARRTACYAASELLGRIARPYCDRLLACNDSGELRIVLDDINSKMREMIGPDAVTLFIETVRDAAKGNR
jgi:hypothetical protein